MVCSFTVSVAMAFLRHSWPELNCRGRDSNPHPFRDRLLRPAWLPVTPPRRSNQIILACSRFAPGKSTAGAKRKQLRFFHFFCQANPLSSLFTRLENFHAPVRGQRRPPLVQDSQPLSLVRAGHSRFGLAVRHHGSAALRPG